MSTSLVYLTGGIATGKSTCTRLLADALGNASIFDADASVHQILTRPSIVSKVATLFGNEVLASSGDVNRRLLRTKVFADDSLREQLEQLLHPEVYEELSRQAESLSNSPQKPSVLLAEIPLLYESTANSQRLSGLEVVVACEEHVQLERLRARDWSEADSKGVLESQMNLRTKMDLADHVIWTSHTEKITKAQVDLLAATVAPPSL